MIIYKNCYMPMIDIMPFSLDKHDRFCRSPKCYSETRHTKINNSELSFGEYLYRELNKKKEIM